MQNQNCTNVTYIFQLHIINVILVLMCDPVSAVNEVYPDAQLSSLYIPSRAMNSTMKLLCVSSYIMQFSFYHNLALVADLFIFSSNRN